jgi:hypothetical protein
MIILPLKNLTDYFYETVIDGVIYLLEFRWNSRHQFWTVDFKDVEGNDLVRGIKLIINYELIRLFARENMPKGALIPVDVTGKLERVTFADVGNNIQFVYVPRNEFDQIVDGVFVGTV